jgi:hypothetical protein
MSRIYCDEIKTTVTGFENVKLYHGFGAFFSKKPIAKCFEDLMMHSEWEICTSTKWLGMIGVIVTGDILLASSFDLFSGIDRENGKRFFDSKQLQDLVYDYKDLVLHEDDPDENNEIVLRNTKVNAIWVTSDASNGHRAIAKKLADKYNLPIVEVGESIFA